MERRKRTALVVAAVVALGVVLVLSPPRRASDSTVPGPTKGGPPEDGARPASVGMLHPKPPVSIHLPAAVPEPSEVRDGSPAGPTLEAAKSLFEVSRILHRNAQEAAENVDRYCAEAAELPKHVLGSSPPVDPDDPNTQERDAAYFLQHRVSWFTHPRSVGSLELPSPLADRIRTAKLDWPTALSPDDAASLDFTWMESLAQFDHWSLATVGPVAAQAAQVDPRDHSIPDYQVLLDWAKLRLLRALAGGDPASALSEVQHLADLINSNGILIAEMGAARILQSETIFLAAAGNAGLQVPPSARPFPDDQSYQRFADLSIGGLAFLFPEVDPAVSRRALACAPNPCGLLSESIWLRRETERFADLPESEFSSLVDQQKGCDGSLFALFEKAPLPDLQTLTGFLGGELPLEKLFGLKVAKR